MVTRQTKLQLANELAAARNENSVLRAQIEALRAENTELRVKYADIVAKPLPSERQYPEIDGRGRRYRLENHRGRMIKCYQPS